jgi:short-subunit dehydrogenase
MSLVAVADELFGLFEKGDFKAAVSLFAPGAHIKQHFAPSNGAPISLAVFESSLTALVQKVGTPKYLNRRVASFEGGFVEQHTSQLTSSKGVLSLEVCLVARTDAEGRITVLEEYLDPSPLAPPRKAKRATTSPPKKPTPPNQEGGAAAGGGKEDALGPGDCCVITGASSGIGAAVAVEYARRGCAVVLAGRDADRLNAAAECCRAQHPACRTLVVLTDVSKPAECAALVSRAVAAFGPPARLVLSAGVSQNATLLESGPALVREMMEINFFGAANTAAAALPHMLAPTAPAAPAPAPAAAAAAAAAAEIAPAPAPAPALTLAVKPRICVISSALGLLTAPKNTGYAASKAALHGFFDSLRSEVGGDVGVTLVAPGPVNTPILQSLSGPGGTRVGLALDEAALAGMMSAEEAARRAVAACEAGEWTCVFPPLDRLVQLRARDPRRVEAMMRAMYAGENGVKAVPVAAPTSAVPAATQAPPGVNARL